MEHEKTPSEQTPSEDNDRRDFLKKCGKFAAVTPPAITMLLSTSLTSNAIAKSGSGGKGPKANYGASQGNKTGWVNGGPGKSSLSNGKK
jgi:hypothetical protein